MSQAEHPLLDPNSELTTEELDQKYNVLMTRWNTARRMNMDQSVLYQLDLLINGIQAERERRRTSDEKPNGVILDTDPITLPPRYR